MAAHLEKTTIYLESADYQRVKALADAANRSAAELIREAVAEYVSRREPRVRPASIGAVRSGRTDLSKRAEELLTGFGETK